MNNNNQSLLQQPGAEHGRTLSFAGPGAENMFSPPQRQEALEMHEDTPPQYSEANSDEQLTVMHESWS
jgi:hypothetical protein